MRFNVFRSVKFQIFTLPSFQEREQAEEEEEGEEEEEEEEEEGEE